MATQSKPYAGAVADLSYNRQFSRVGGHVKWRDEWCEVVSKNRTTVTVISPTRGRVNVLYHNASPVLKLL